jgi:hypothetical protein
MSVPSKPNRSKTPRAEPQSGKPAKPRRRRAEKQSEASIPLADLAARKKARTAKIEINSELLAHAHVSKAWPFEEARKVLSRLKRIPKPTGAIIFETGYGPSGLPHIGTFGEVARTTMVRHAFRVLTEDKIPTRLICFSDDMDGLRRASATTIMRGCVPSSTRSASNTSSSRRPNATPAGASTRRCSRCFSITTRSAT